MKDAQGFYVYEIKVEHPKTALNLTFKQKMKLLFNREPILYTDVSFDVTGGTLIIKTKNIMQ
jgi:hypothetical protein